MEQDRAFISEQICMHREDQGELGMDPHDVLHEEDANGNLIALH